MDDILKQVDEAFDKRVLTYAEVDAYINALVAKLEQEGKK